MFKPYALMLGNYRVGWYYRTASVGKIITMEDDPTEKYIVEYVDNENRELYVNGYME